MMKTFFYWAFFVGIVGSSPIVQAQPKDSEETKRLIAEGQKYFEAGDCKKAYPILQDAFSRSAQPGLLTSIAQCAEFLKDNPEALAAYCAYQTIEPNSPYKDTINQSIQDLRKATGSDCPAQSKYLPKAKEAPTSPTPEKEKKLTTPITLATIGAICGTAAIGIRLQAKSSGELSKSSKHLGLALAIASDLSFIGAGATFYLSLKKPDKTANQPQETALLFSLELPLP
jgi:hypothetical protein